MASVPCVVGVWYWSISMFLFTCMGVVSKFVFSHISRRRAFMANRNILPASVFMAWVTFLVSYLLALVFCFVDFFVVLFVF